MSDEGKVITVRGPIESSEVGACFTHEHILFDWGLTYWTEPDTDELRALADSPIRLDNRGILQRNPFVIKENFWHESVHDAAREVAHIKAAGGRTLDRTLVTLPNGRLADTRTETFGARDRIRLNCTLSLVFGTTAEQMRRVLEGVEAVLRGHPKIYPDNIIVRFAEIGASSLDVQVMAWFVTTDWNEFLAIRQEVLLGFLEVVERAGTSFAFPTQTIHLARENGGPARAVNLGAGSASAPDRGPPRP
jgi:hypothetical protein